MFQVMHNNNIVKIIEQEFPKPFFFIQYIDRHAKPDWRYNIFAFFLH